MSTPVSRSIETFVKRLILFKAKKGENFNHPSTICRTYGAGRNTLSILRIKIWALRLDWAKGGVLQRSRIYVCV